jgi:hypothetical protein
MAQVICEVSPGLRESEKTVAVKDVFNRCHHLRVEDGFIASEGGRHYLPIGIVGLDDAKGLALVELPHESKSTSNPTGSANLGLMRQPLHSEFPSPMKCRSPRSITCVPGKPFSWLV